LALIVSGMCGETRHCSSPVQYSLNSEAWWWQQGQGRLVAIEGKMNAAKYRDILEENLEGSPSNKAKIAKITKE